MIERLISPRMQERAVYTLLVWSVLWRGGKSLESTWFFIGVAGYLTLAWYEENRREKKQSEQCVPRAVWWSAVLFFLLTAASYLLSRTRTYGLDEVLATGATVVMLFWVVRHRYRETFGGTFLRLLAVLAVLASIVGMVVYVFQPVSRFVGTFFDARFHTDYWPNAWAQFLLLAWPAVLLCTLRARSIRTRAVWYAGLALCLAALLLSYSRGGMIAFAGQLVLLMLLFRTSAPRGWMKRASASFAIVLLSALLLSASLNVARTRTFAVESIAAKATFSADEGASSISERRSFWSAALRLTGERPLLGWGPYSFRFVQPRLQESVLATSDHPHNVFLKISMERGIPALIVFVVLLSAILLPRRSLFLPSEPSSGSSERTLAGIVLVAVAGVLAHNLIDYNLQFVGIAFPLTVFLGLLCGRATKRAEGASRRATEVSIACGLLIIALLEGRLLVLSSVARHAEAAAETQRALQWYDRAADQWFSRDLHLSRTRLLLEEGRTDEARAALDLGLSENPEDARAWKMLGDMERGESAVRAYENALSLGGLNDLSITHALMRTLSRTDSGAFLNYLPVADGLLTRFGEAVEKNTHFIALSSNVEEFIALANFLADRFPGRAPRYEVAAARVETQARRERERTESRPPGFLW